jgi:hypothetical protein
VKSNPCVLSDAPKAEGGSGATRNNSGCAFGHDQSRDGSRRCESAPGGSGHIFVMIFIMNKDGSLNPAGVGSSHPGDRMGPGVIHARRSGQTPDDEKLNHERGESPCQSVRSETVPKRERPSPTGTGKLLVSVPGNHALSARTARANNDRCGSIDRAATARGVSPSTDVTDRTQTIANAGISADAGLVPGASAGAGVFQPPQRGSVA